MADFTKIVNVSGGKYTSIDISNNTLVTTSVKVGGPATNTELTKAILDKLIAGTYATNTFRLQDSTDATKQISFDATAITTATTRSLKMPNANVDLAALTDSNISASAAIARSKLANGTANRVLVNGSGGALTEVAITANKALASDASGLPTASATTDTELGFLSGTTSSVQTQLNARIKVDGTSTMTGNLNVGGNLITNLGTPVSSTDAVNKSYVDNIQSGLKWKAPVRAATTNNITLSGLQTVDGVALAGGDRVLVKDQTTGSQNGIYLANASAWVRSADADQTPGDELTMASVFVAEGSVNIDRGYVCVTTSITLGTTPLVWIQFTSAGSYNAGAGISITGSTIAAVTDGQGIGFNSNQLSITLDGTTLSKSALGLRVANNGIADAQIATSAAIARSKVAAGTANHVVTNDGSGNLSSTARLATTQLPAPSAAGALLLGNAGGTDFASVAMSGDATISATGVLTVSNSIKTGIFVTLTNTTGSTVNAGQIVALSKSTAGGFILANAAAIASCEGVVGVATSTINSAASGQIQVAGAVNIAGSFIAGDLGSRVYISDTTAGSGTTTAPSALNSVIHMIGVLSNAVAGTIVLNPQLVAINS